MSKRWILLAALVTLAASEVAMAESSRVYVSTLGRDSATCGALLNPCRNLQAAVTQVKPGGEIVITDGGPYPGATLSKPVTLSALSGVGTIALAFPGLSVSLGSRPEDVVTLRGLTLRGDTVGLIGVQLYQGRTLQIDGCTFANMGTAVGATAGQTVITNTVFRNNQTGIDAQAIQSGVTVGVTLEGSTFSSNNTGISAARNATISARNCTFADNDAAVMTFPSGGDAATVVLSHSLVANNRTGVFANTGGGTSTIRLGDVTITGNGVGVQATPGTTVGTLGNNMIMNNGIDVSGSLEPPGGSR
jgi:hypothetical protein